MLQRRRETVAIEATTTSSRKAIRTTFLRLHSATTACTFLPIAINVAPIRHSLLIGMPVFELKRIARGVEQVWWLTRFRGQPIVGAERSVHDAEEPSAVPTEVPAGLREVVRNGRTPE